MTRSCVVTGAAGDLGRAIVIELTRDDWHVVGVDLRESSEASVSIVGDVSDPEVHQRAAAAASDLGALQGWVNCAGYNVIGSVATLSREDLERGVSVNLLGVFFGAAAACRTMLAEPSSEVRSIVNISSIQASVGMRGFAAYAMAKGGIEALTRQIAAEYRMDGIRCNAVAPGLIVGEMNEKLLAGAEDPDALLAGWRHLTPAGEWGRPRDVAAVVRFLLGPEAKFMNGEVVHVDGGALAIAPGQVTT